MHYDTKQLRNHAEHFARMGASAVRERLRRPGATDARTKSSATDYVTVCDTTSEAAIREAARETWGDAVDYSFVGEEGGAEPARPGALQLIVDPVDGTANLRSGAPEFGVSVAIAADGLVLAGAVAEPVSGRLYSAARGHGALLYDPNVVHQSRPLQARVGRPLAERLLATGFSYLADERVPQAQVVARMIDQVEDVRRGGSAVMDLCRVAQGVLGAYYEHHLHVWDWSAGLLICEEAGAVVSWPGTGGPAAHLGDPIVACAPEIADDFLRLLKEAGAAGLARRVEDVQPEWVTAHAS
ncbi:inositol monophosphatase family protein [Lentzea chajnantorensis]